MHREAVVDTRPNEQDERNAHLRIYREIFPTMTCVKSTINWKSGHRKKTMISHAGKEVQKNKTNEKILKMKIEFKAMITFSFWFL